MNRLISRGLSLFVALLLALPTSARAATIFKSFDFTASTSGPTPVHNGSFSFTYDSATFAPTLSSIDLAIGSTTFSTGNADLILWGQGPEYFLMGKVGGQGMAIGHNDFWLIFKPLARSARHFAYSQVGFDGMGGAGLPGIRLVDTTPGVPEPSTWAMLIVGFAVVGWSLRRRSVLQVAAGKSRLNAS